MSDDDMPGRGSAALMTLILLLAPLTRVQAEALAPLPRPAAESGRDARWLERLPPATQPLPQPSALAQSGVDSLQDALRRLASRVESGAIASPPPRAPAADTPPAPVTPTSVDPAPPPTSVAPPPAPGRAGPPADTEPAPAKQVPTVATSSLDADARRWQVQLLAGRSLARVERDRDDLLRFHGDRFEGLTLAISHTPSGGRYRLRARAWTHPSEADAWCQRLRAATGLRCLVVRGDDGSAPAPTSPDAPPSPAR